MHQLGRSSGAYYSTSCGCLTCYHHGCFLRCKACVSMSSSDATRTSGYGYAKINDMGSILETRLPSLSARLQRRVLRLMLPPPPRRMVQLSHHQVKWCVNSARKSWPHQGLLNHTGNTPQAKSVLPRCLSAGWNSMAWRGKENEDREEASAHGRGLCDCRCFIEWVYLWAFYWRWQSNIKFLKEPSDRHTGMLLAGKRFMFGFWNISNCRRDLITVSNAVLLSQLIFHQIWRRRRGSRGMPLLPPHQMGCHFFPAGLTLSSYPTHPWRLSKLVKNEWGWNPELCNSRATCAEKRANKRNLLNNSFTQDGEAGEEGEN